MMTLFVSFHQRLLQALKPLPWAAQEQPPGISHQRNLCHTVFSGRIDTVWNAISRFRSAFLVA
jgi:hypothetical protein